MGNNKNEIIKPVSVHVRDNYAAMSETAMNLIAESIVELLERQEYVTIMPSVGGSTEKLFELLVKFNHTLKIDWSRIIVVQMDEYHELTPDNPSSLAFSILKKMIEPLGIKRFYLLNIVCGVDQDFQKYEMCIDSSGGVDIAIHGIGENGHLGFNEPGSSFDSRTRVVDLHSSTVHANSRFFNNDAADVPIKGITIGLQSVLKTKINYLLASGLNKRDSISAALNGSVGTNVPASILQLHNNTTVILDKDAS